MYKIYCVNMERRQDRKQEMMQKTKDMDISFFKAVDGSKLEMTDEIKNIFKNNKFNWRSGIIGCALSHIYLWRELVQSNQNYFLILEDDTDLHPNFKNQISPIINHIEKFGIDFLFLGHHYSNFKNYEFQNLHSIAIAPINKLKYGGSTGGYILSKRGAQSLLDWINKNGCNDPIDDEIMKWNQTVHLIFTCEPHLIKNTIGGDTDVQHEFPRLI